MYNNNHYHTIHHTNESTTANTSTTKSILSRTFFSKYKCRKKLGQGSFGLIFKCTSTTDNTSKYALKLEPKTNKHYHLKSEYHFLQSLQSPHIPKVYQYGTVTDYNVMIMELLGKSLEDLIEQYHAFSIKTVYMLLIQMLEALAFIHDNDIVHRDIKPDNFVMGVHSKAYNLYVIDFGLSREYRDSETKEHYPLIKKKKLCGTARYASINALACYEQSRRDDLESVSYVAVYLIKGELPWQGVKGKTKEERYAKILEMKRRMNEDDICNGIDGKEVKEFIKYVRGLGYEEEPEYEKWINVFKDVLERRFKWKEEFDYEWSRKERKKKKKERMMVLTMRTREDKEDSGNDYDNNDNDDKRKYNNVIQYNNNAQYTYGNNDNNNNRTKTYLSTYNSNYITITNDNNNNKDTSYKVDRDKTDNKCCIIY